jgi:hypothetical protein
VGYVSTNSSPNKTSLIKVFSLAVALCATRARVFLC